MVKIFYSLAGEGLGHCSRFLSFLDFCPKDWNIHVFTWGESYDFLKQQNYPHLYKINSLPFGRIKGKISLVKTLFNTLKYIIRYLPHYKRLIKLAKVEKPDLFISDCEGILPRVAKKLKMPCVSIDNQHRFSRCFSVDLPLNLRFYALVMGVLSEWLIPNPTRIIVSIFYYAKLKKTDNKTFIVNCFMRKEVEEVQPSDGDYILVYYKPSVGPTILHLLSQTNEKVKVYGCSKELYPQFEYHKIGSDNFIKDLAGCKALFCCSGNQLLGEAVYYGKNVFTVPELHQPEQYINAFCLKKMNYGEFCYYEYLNMNVVKDFLNNLKARKPVGINGARQAVDIIKGIL